MNKRFTIKLEPSDDAILLVAKSKGPAERPGCRAVGCEAQAQGEVQFWDLPHEVTHTVVLCRRHLDICMDKIKGREAIEFTEHGVEL